MAEYLGRRRLQNVLPINACIASAGIRPQPKEDTRNAVQTLKKLFDIDASQHVPQDVYTIDRSKYDLIITIDDPGKNRIAAAMQTLGIQADRHLRWHIADPWGPDPTEYEKAALNICKELARLRKRLETKSPAS